MNNLTNGIKIGFQDIDNLRKERKILEAFILTQLWIERNLYQTIFYEFVKSNLNETQRNNLWEIVKNVWQFPNILRILSIIVPVDSSKSQEFKELKKKIRQFNDFRNKVIHRLIEERITDNEIEPYLSLGKEIIEKINSIKFQILKKY